MKNFNKLKAFTMIFVMMLSVNYIFSQATGDNNPAGGKFLGFNAGQNLEVRTNNTTYMQMMQNGNSTINGFNINRSGFVGLSQNPTFFTTGPQSPFSLLHLNGDNNAGNAQEIGYRSWMRHGITLTHNQDLMYVGQRRLTNDVTDAVIAWADNELFPGPDNLCFVFTKGDGSGTTPTEPDTDFGREIARMIAIGHTGIGIQWSNTFQPKRTLDVVRHESIPQFRITRQRSTSVTGGVYTDFETSGAGHLHILPRNGVTRNVGIGFLSSTSTPTERLDVYDGTARLRQVPANEPHVLITGRKQDVDPTDGDYVLNYLQFSQNPNEVLNGQGDWVDVSGSLCDWNIVNGGADVAMGYPGACVERATGIGTDTPESKLEVDFSGNLPVGFNDIAVDATIATYNEGNSFNRIAVRGEARNDYEELIFNQYGGYFSGYGGRFTYGVFGDALRSPYLNQNTLNAGAYGRSQDVSESGYNIGVKGFAQNSKFNYGVHGQAMYDSGMGGPQPDYNYGVYGYACFASQRNYGVYGEICQGSPGYAGYFNGALFATSGPWTGSDESLKQNIESFEGALGVISQLQPKTYEFISDLNSELNLPSEQQIGLIAQELEEVLPYLVRNTIHPATNDAEGNVIQPELEFKAVNYTGLIPVLIAGMKEQQTIIESQNEVLAQMMEQLANMQQQINQCCNASDDSKTMPGGVIQPQDLNNEKSIEGGNELYQNIPNPFRESTTISYLLEQGGRVQLSVYDSNGKVITTLVDARQDSGRHSTVWNANGMPAGVYHYALYVDGELLVKRAIKLQE